MSKMGADLADLKSKIKAQNKKGTAIEQEADKNTNLRLSAHFNELSGKPQAASCAFLLLGPVPINTTPRRCRVDNHIGLCICFCNCNNTQHAHDAHTHQHPTCNMHNRQPHLAPTKPYYRGAGDNETTGMPARISSDMLHIQKITV
jgi:hypothetical protein